MFNPLFLGDIMDSKIITDIHLLEDKLFYFVSYHTGSILHCTLMSQFLLIKFYHVLEVFKMERACFPLIFLHIFRFVKQLWYFFYCIERPVFPGLLE